jgi:hypothetical protein
MEWSTAISVGLLFIALAGLYLNTSATYLAIREHEAFRASVQREFDQLRYEIRILQETRPTTGELEARLGVNGHTRRSN